WPARHASSVGGVPSVPGPVPAIIYADKDNWRYGIRAVTPCRAHPAVNKSIQEHGGRPTLAELDGKVALITGGSRGIGRAIALELAKHGATIAVNYRSNKEAADNVVSTIMSAGGKAAAFEADVSDFDQSKQMVEKVISELGPITILIN